MRAEREVCQVQRAATLLSISREREDRTFRHEPLESRVRGNVHALFGGGPTEKDWQQHLAGGLPDSEGGSGKRTGNGTSPDSLPHETQRAA
jgi:hypothetical protein